MKHSRHVILLALLSVFSFHLVAQPYRIVGYYPTYRFWLRNSIEFDKLTHVNISFANPDANGDLTMTGNTAIASEVTYIHTQGAKVLVSIAGGALSWQQKQNYANLMKPENRAGFITKIEQFLVDNDLDGIDVDIEGSVIDANYGDFVVALADSLQPKGYLVTAALARGTGPQVPDEAVEVFDFINIMSYDYTGPWSPTNEGPHSSYQHAVNDMTYWKNRGATQDQLVLGVPFYGYKFNNGAAVNTFTFSQIVANNPSGSENVDEVDDTYYNGKFTIMDKTDYALVYGSGIMIWELGQDSFGQHSLLKVIHERFPVTTGVEDENVSTDLITFPNPAENELTVLTNETSGTVSVYNGLGKIVMSHSFENTFGQPLQLEVGDLSAGTYLLYLQTEKRIYTTKFAK